MKKIHILVALVGLYALAVVPAAAQAPPDAIQWKVAHSFRMVSAVEYELYDKSNQLGHVSNGPGVELGWVQGHMGGLWEFRHEAPPNTTDHRRRPISTTDKVALYNTNARRYLKYYARTAAVVEVAWTTTASYEWQLHDQSTAGEQVNFALFNLRVRKYLVSRGQQLGIALGWYATPTTPATLSFSLTLSAHPINQGWVPYVGKFPIIGVANGNLLTVQNASSSATLMFLKPGKTTPDCADPNATIRVAPRAMMTADQMKILYGPASPRFPISFLACLTTPTTQTISSTPINITYKLDP